MGPLNSVSFSSSKSKSPIRRANFIEALKDFGTSVKKQSQDATLGVGKSMVDQLFGASPASRQPQSGELTPDQSFNFDEYLKSREKLIVSQERQRFERRIEEERLIFHRKQEEAKLQIKAVQNELKKLADATVGLTQEVKKATAAASVDPGTYHENFFDRLRKLIELARKRIVESKTWLETFNQRCTKRSYYWGQVQTSGTKFMLSGERSMVTQVG